MVHKVNAEQRTFAEFAEMLQILLKIGSESECIDVVFDTYRTISTKNVERDLRSPDDNAPSVKIIPAHKIRQWKEVLASSTNKNEIIIFVAREWKKQK